MVAVALGMEAETAWSWTRAASISRAGRRRELAIVPEAIGRVRSTPGLGLAAPGGTLESREESVDALTRALEARPLAIVSRKAGVGAQPAGQSRAAPLRAVGTWK